MMLKLFSSSVASIGQWLSPEKSTVRRGAIGTPARVKRPREYSKSEPPKRTRRGHQALQEYNPHSQEGEQLSGLPALQPQPFSWKKPQTVTSGPPFVDIWTGTDWFPRRQSMWADDGRDDGAHSPTSVSKRLVWTSRSVLDEMQERENKAAYERKLQMIVQEQERRENEIQQRMYKRRQSAPAALEVEIIDVEEEPPQSFHTITQEASVCTIVPEWTPKGRFFPIVREARRSSTFVDLDIQGRNREIALLEKQVEEQVMLRKRSLRFDLKRKSAEQAALTARIRSVEERQRAFARLEVRAEERRRLLLQQEEAMRIKVMAFDPEEEVNKLMRPLTDEEKDKVDWSFYGGSPRDVLVKTKLSDLTRNDVLCLRNGEWLNDEVVNLVMTNIADKSAKRNGGKKIHVFNTFFYARLLRDGYNYASVRRWTRKVDISSMDLVILPIHLGVHWCCAAIDMEHKAFRYFDSMGGHNSRCIQAMRRWLVDEMKDKTGSTLDLSDWKNDTPGRSVPQQNNGCDCGVFMCTFAEFLALGAPFSFHQRDMPLMRRRYLVEILKMSRE